MAKITVSAGAALLVASAALVGTAYAQQKHPAAGPAAAPHVSAPAAPRMSAPAAPHISAPAPHFAAPRVNAAPHVNAAPRINMAPRFAAPRMSHAPHVAMPRTFAAPRRAHSFVRPNARGPLAGRSFSRPSLHARTAGRAIARPASPNRFTGHLRGPNRIAGHPSARAHFARTPPPSVARGPLGRRAGPHFGNNPRHGLANPRVANNQAIAASHARSARSEHMFREVRARRFADRRHFHGGFVAWLGPVFWPYAYDDVFDYAFWPAEYDESSFWTAAYDDVFAGIIGPSAYADADILAAYAATDRGQRARRARARVFASVPSGEFAQVCSNPAPDITNWPIERIVQVVHPTDAQKAALDALRTAADQAMEALKVACPTDRPATPLGRLDAVAQRLEAMLKAADIVRPALTKFYESLDDEQKARFNTIGREQLRTTGRRDPGRADARRPQGQGPQACSDEAPGGLSDRAIRRIEQAVRPSTSQREALDQLKEASAKAIERLRAACPAPTPITPTARLEALAGRLAAMLDAARTMRPPLATFYGSLSDEQKAQFNALGSLQG